MTLDVWVVPGAHRTTVAGERDGYLCVRVGVRGTTMQRLVRDLAS